MIGMRIVLLEFGFLPDLLDSRLLHVVPWLSGISYTTKRFKEKHAVKESEQSSPYILASNSSCFHRVKLCPSFSHSIIFSQSLA
jgi:hypothetical protein